MGTLTPHGASAGPWRSHFSGLEQQLLASGPDWLRRLRADGFSTFDRLGLPTTALEAWKTTNVQPIARTEFKPAPRDTVLRASDLPELARLDLGGPRLLFLDGRYVPELSRPTERDGLWIGSLASAVQSSPQRVESILEQFETGERPAFHALNTAFLEDGALVWIPDRLDLEKPVQLLYVSSGASAPTTSHPRTIVATGAGSRAAVVQTYVGLGRGAYLTNAVTQILLGPDSQLRRDRIQAEEPQAFHIANSVCRQGRSSRLTSCCVDLGGRLARHDLTVILDGEGADCHLDGLYVTAGDQHLANHTVLDHALPHGTSREVYKGILTGNSRTVFHGKIVVRQDAQQTNAKQSNPNLLLSSAALAHTRPQLEILANDVKCTHGATIGQLDPEAVFYLRSRGLSRSQAQHLLVEAFAAEILDAIPFEALGASLRLAVTARLLVGDV